MTIALLDPSVASENLGDEIIRDAVITQLRAIMPEEQIVHLPTQEVIGPRSIRIAGAARHRIVGGTNLLSSHMLRYRQWKIGLNNARRIGPAILMGVGWWQYQDDPDLYTRGVLGRALSRQGLHSVRDSYTRDKLARIGFDNVLNTCCPTTWQLTPDHCATVPANAAEEVVLTLTDYHKAPEADLKLIDLLTARYRKVYYWPQGTGDLVYARELGRLDRMELIKPSLAAYDDVLSERPVDFIGTRLHAGIRALQKKRRTMILAVDNRSREIAKDIDLPVFDRTDLSALEAGVVNARPVSLRLPTTEIGRWKAQFT